MNGHSYITLRERIAKFRSKGWINALEEAEQLQLLRVAESSKDSSAAEQILRSLEFVEKKNLPRNTEGSNSNRVGSRSGSKKHDEEEDPNVTKMNLNHYDDTSATTSDIAQKRAMKNSHIIPFLHTIDYSGKPEGLRDLFVEMCFFARLGFLQPPSCLSCAFLDAKLSRDGDNSNRVVCRCPVVWRKDATQSLHPDRLGGDASDSGIVITTCTTAQAWMRDEVVEGFCWDRKLRKLVPSH
uniref:Uncharacterized protein n=1 Tax=Odontella aurita TaxID=265563 RepID=A0A7S4M7U7_9STRA|mmetsp:Transcript_13490/g.39388  ORF Transcript_13490/g.39388 Transcript_13490/m.39388 type:complete len:240 (+) Transcript_13490:291-1010(+)